MTGRRALGLVFAGPLALAPGVASAHGFGQRYTLPVPLWLYLYGAAATVVLSFVAVGYFVGETHAARGYPRLNVLRFRPFRATLASRPCVAALRCLSVACLALVVCAGLFGNQEPTLNVAPTFVWIVWWVGFGYVTALVGNLWPLINPWKVTFEWADGLARRLGVEEGLELYEPYPARLGAWPALAAYFAFVWVELVYVGSPSPLNLAALALLYSVVTWVGMAYFGKHVWLRHGEAFSVFFGILGRFAPSEVRVRGREACAECGGCAEGEPLPAEDGCVNCYECYADAPPERRELNLRPPAVGLLRPERMGVDRLAFVVFMLASVTVDGLFATNLWVRVQTVLYPLTQHLGPTSYTYMQTAALLLLPVLFLLVYVGFSALVRAFGGGSVRLGAVATGFVYSLVPIALAYQLAHYYTLLLIQGQGVIALASDPFGWGWDLWGTADYRVNLALVSARAAWYSQVLFVVLGHVIAVYLAHVVALRLVAGPRRALRSQYPMLALMVLYTISSLWILSQPIVEERRSADSSPAPAIVGRPLGAGGDG